MKIALITDLHYGIKADHSAFNENNKRFFDDVFFPYLERHNIGHVVCLGDLVDRRKYVNYATAQRMRHDFIEPMINNNIKFDWILGNHDIYYRQDMSVSAASELYSYYHTRLKDYQFTYYTEATEVVIDGLKILYLPWICDANREYATKMIEETDAQIVFGHLELAGFEMYKGIFNDHGESADIYRKFDTVCTGHFHHRSYRNGIYYLGSHCDFSWADCGDDRGFHIFDTSNRELVFVKNPYPMYVKLFYDENKENRFAPEMIQGKFVKVIVKNRSDSDKYNAFMTACEAAQPLDLQIVEDHLNLNLTSDDDVVGETKDTLTILREYVAQANSVVNVTKLDKLMVELYTTAQNT